MVMGWMGLGNGLERVLDLESVYYTLVVEVGWKNGL